MIAALAALALMAGCSRDGAVDETVTVPEADQVWTEETETPQIEETEPGKEAPDFTVEMVDGGEKSLSDYEGKVLVIDFWATWCKSCVKELPDYQKLYESWDHEKVAYLGMSLDGDRSRVKAYLQTKPDLTLPMGIPGEDIVDAYLPKRAIPASRVIDQEGIVRYEFTGPATDKVEEAVRRLLEDGGEGNSEE